MPRQIALLRGVNLGPNRRVAMAALRELLSGHGHEDVRTLLQSGNVVLSSTLKPPRLERLLAEQIAEGFGFDVPVVVRTRDELAEVIERNPLAEVADDPKRLQVTFLSAEPDPAAIAGLEDVALGGERFVVSGREIYAWHPDGLARSELAKQLAGRKVAGTARNWNTVTKLLALADA
jgi:uncharacterized protein (DUF1697 family)